MLKTSTTVIGQPYTLLMSDAKVLSVAIKERLETIDKILNEKGEFNREFSSRKEASAHERMIVDTAGLCAELTTKTNMLISLVHRTFDIEKYAKDDGIPVKTMEVKDGD